MANPITNKVKTGGIPVIKKDLEDGVIAEANNDGTIFLDKKVKNNSPLAKEAIAHEMVHMDQMARGDLDYNDNNVIWKGKEYSREQMNEGSKNLPWEKEAYNKTENMKKSPAKLSLSSGAIDVNRDVIISDLESKAGKRGAISGAVDGVLGKVKGFDAFSKSTGSGDKGTNPNPEEDSAAEMNKKNKNKSAMKMKSTPITKKSQYGGSSSPLHIETKTSEEYKETKKGNNIETDEFGTFTITGKPGEKSKGGYQKVYDTLPEKDGKKYNPRTGTVYNQVSDFEDEAKKKPAAKGTETVEFEADKDKNQDPAVPGSTERNMGYYESMDAKWGAGERNRSDKKVRRISERAANKFDRKEGGIIDPSTGEAYGNTKEGKAKYIKDRAGSATATFDLAVGKSRFTPGKEAGPITESNTPTKAGETFYKKINGKLVKVDAKGNPIGMNSNKNKSAFKMKGWQAK